MSDVDSANEDHKAKIIAIVSADIMISRFNGRDTWNIFWCQRILIFTAIVSTLWNFDAKKIVISET